jgi:ech hydrogenase subunit C
MSGINKSPWLLHYDASSCNGCDIETLACLTPIFDVERLGVLNTGNPKHADIFLVTGAVNEQSKVVIQNLYRQLPEPKVVVAIGACASSGGIFRDCYNILGGVDKVVPVDVYVPGCAARPEAIIDGVVKGLGVMGEKQAALTSLLAGLDNVVYARAEKTDAPSLHDLRKMAAQRDAVLHHSNTLPTLRQTVKSLEEEFGTRIFVKAVVNGKIIGAVSGSPNGPMVQVYGPAVHPYFENTGVRRDLLKEIEAAFPEAKRFETSAGHKSEVLLRDLAESGYQNFNTEVSTPNITRVHLRKVRP